MKDCQVPEVRQRAGKSVTLDMCSRYGRFPAMQPGQKAQEAFFRRHMARRRKAAPARRKMIFDTSMPAGKENAGSGSPRVSGYSVKEGISVKIKLHGKRDKSCCEGEHHQYKQQEGVYMSGQQP